MSRLEADQLAELAVLYAVGLLSTNEADQFQDRLLAGDQAVLAEWHNVRPAADFLLGSVRPVEPTLIARSDLINAMGLSKPLAAFSRPPATPDRMADPIADDALGMVLLRAADIEWQDLPAPGARVRNLFIDKTRGRATLLIKLEPGTAFPDHEHPDVEECLVLEGDLELGGRVMRRFDYMRIPKGGQHGTPRTTNGCIVLVTCGIAA